MACRLLTSDLNWYSTLFSNVFSTFSNTSVGLNYDQALSSKVHIGVFETLYMLEFDKKKYVITENLLCPDTAFYERPFQKRKPFFPRDRCARDCPNGKYTPAPTAKTPNRTITPFVHVRPML